MNLPKLLVALSALGIIRKVNAATQPTGMIGVFANSTVPTGWLECNGALVSRTTYAALFAAIGTTYGAGDGATTFNLPDLRGEFIRGWDHGKGTDVGRAIGSAQSAAMQNHTHILAVERRQGGTGTTGHTIPGDNGVSLASQNLNTGNPSAGGGTETRPRNIAMMYCIKT